MTAASHSAALALAGLVTLGLSALGASARASTVLFDFETDADVKAWHDEGGTTIGGGKSLERVQRFATSGASSMCFRTPQWKQGLSEWPAFETRPTVTDWSGCDRLVFDLTNASAYDQMLCLFVSDSKVATRDGLFHRVLLPPLGYQQVVIPLAQFAEHNVNPKDVHVMHLFTERPPGDMEVYLDHLVLLRPGEPLPTPAAAFVKELGTLLSGQVTALRQAQQEAQARVQQTAAKAPAVLAWARGLLAENDRQVAAFADQVARGDSAILRGSELVVRLREDTARLESLVQLRADFEPVRQAVQVQPDAPGDLVVGFATSMEKVRPRSVVPKVETSRRASLSLARNEREAFQVIVLPCEQKARQVSVRVSDLKGPGGARFAAKNITAVPVGYVETRGAPTEAGWWPDPILDFMSAADIAVGDAQAFWVRLHAPADQRAGQYRGKLEVLVAGAPRYAFDLAVQVYSFAVPIRSPLNSAITFSPRYFEPTGDGGWREGAYRDTSWQKHKLEWGDFLADYYITYDSLYAYENWAPDFDVLQRLHQEGRLGTFNLGYYGVMGEKPEEQAAWKADVLRRIGEPYQKAKALGLLDHAYIYGCDENPAEMFPGVERAAAALKQMFPGAFILTTTYDHSFGTNSVLQSMDGFCPLTPSFKSDLAERVRATGKQVWWYICCGPVHPYCNMFVEYPAIEGRLLMGAQTAKYRPDGFLYYQISIWNGKPITTGPFTDWDPRSFSTINGDGSWTCLGPDSTPLATIRLENYRDGLEDYAYVRVLEEVIRRYEARPSLSAKDQQWLTEAKAAVPVPATVLKSSTEYTRDPAALYAWRNRIGELIDASGITDADPWGKDWGTRGPIATAH